MTTFEFNDVTGEILAWLQAEPASPYVLIRVDPETPTDDWRVTFSSVDDADAFRARWQP